MARTATIIVTGAVALALGAPSFALAAPAVTNTNNSGGGSLRAAIAGAAPGDTIPVPAGTYNLTSGELNINKSLTLDGANARTTIITAGGRSFRVVLNTGNSTLRD